MIASDDTAILADSVESLLRSLSYLDIPEYFMRLGIRGAKLSAQECPLAKYLKGALRVEQISVGNATCGWHHALSGSYYCVNLPPEVAFFTEQFDRGMYPELEC